MRLLVALLLLTGLASALLVAGLLPATASSHYSRAGTKACGFAPRTPGVASDEGLEVWARRVSCPTARRIARDYAYGGQQRPSGFACVRRGRQQGDRQSGIAHTDYRCSLGKRVVVFAGS
jgi:hypothetical protein